MKGKFILVGLVAASVANAEIFDSGIGLGWAIPDEDAATFNLNVSGLTGSITQIDLYFDPEHTFSGDLAIDVIAPDATALDLLETPGNAGANSGISDRHLKSIFFQDTGANAEFWGGQSNGTVDSATSGIIYAHSNAFFTNPFSAATVVSGVYTFEAIDFAAGDTGTIDRVVIHTTGAPVPEPAAFAVLGLGVLALIRRRR